MKCLLAGGNMRGFKCRGVGGRGAGRPNCVVLVLKCFKRVRLFSAADKLVYGSRVGQVGPVDSCGQVGDLDPSLADSCNLSRVGQVRPVDSCAQVRNINLSGSK